MNNYQLILNLSQKIEEINKELNALASQYLNSPWMGSLIFLGLFIFCYCGIASLNKK